MKINQDLDLQLMMTVSEYHGSYCAAGCVRIHCVASIFPNALDAAHYQWRHSRFSISMPVNSFQFLFSNVFQLVTKKPTAAFSCYLTHTVHCLTHIGQFWTLRAHINLDPYRKAFGQTRIRDIFALNHSVTMWPVYGPFWTPKHGKTATVSILYQLTRAV